MPLSHPRPDASSAEHDRCHHADDAQRASMARNDGLKHVIRRFLVSALSSLLLLMMTLGAHLTGIPAWMTPRSIEIIQCALATLAVFWGGWPFLTRGVRPLFTRRFNRFTPAAMGVLAVYAYGLAVLLLPEIAGYGAPFATAAVLSAIALLEQALELGIGLPQAGPASEEAPDDRILAYFIPAVIAVAVAAALLWLWLGPEPKAAYALMSAAAVLMAASPGALQLAAPIAVAAGIRHAAQHGIVLRDAASLETLATIDTLVLDKSGLLTEGTPRLLNVMPCEGYTEPNLLRMAASLERYSDHPLAAAIIDGAEKRGVGMLTVFAFKAIPGKGVTGIMDGRSVAVGNAALMQSLGVQVLKTRAEPYRSQGQMVVFMSVDGHPAGLLTIADPIRNNAADALKALKAAGLSIVMLTGDNKSTALAVGRKLGIEHVEPEVLPERKADIIRKLQAKGRKVAMAENIVLPGSDLSALVRARHLSAAVLKATRQNLLLAMTFNLLSIMLAAGILYPFLGLRLSPAAAGIAALVSSALVMANCLRTGRAA